MEHIFKQFRYFGEHSLQNNITKQDLLTGQRFENYYTPIVQLGIRALPGTKIYLNGSEDPIIVGYLGIFELDFSQGGSITSLRFNENSVNEIDNNLQGGYIIIDLLGLGQGEGGV